MVKRGLLYQGILESGLSDSVLQLDEAASKAAHRLLRTAFGNPNDSASGLWMSFQPASHIWSGVEESLADALRAVKDAGQDGVLLLEEAWRDPIVLQTNWHTLPRLVTEAWYPSDDLYVCDPRMHWCLVFTHHDTIALYERDTK